MALTDGESSGIPATMLVGPTSVGNTGYPYPVYQNGNGNGFGQDGWWIILLIIIIAMGGWNNNGFGANNGGGRGGRSYEDRSYNMSYDDGVNELKESIYEIMDDLPESAKHDAQKFVKKLESM